MNIRNNRVEEPIDAILEWGMKGLLIFVFLGIILFGLWHVSHILFSLVWQSLPWIFAGAVLCGGWQWAKKNLF